MKKNFPYLIFISALLISCTGSFFSIYGLGKLFGGHQLGATIIAFSFEFGNIITAAALKAYWKFLPRILKFPLVIVVFVLTIITTMGLYGFLADGYQKTATKDLIVQKKSGLVKLKKDNFQLRIDDFKKELENVNNSISDLTKGLNTNTQTERIDSKTGQKITNVIVSSKKSIDNQLSVSNNRKIELNSKIESLQDSVQRLELTMIEIEANNSNASELGPLKYLADLTGYPMNRIVNWLILLIVIVFQPLAIMLILVSMFAFKNNHYLTRNSSSKKAKPSKPILDNLKETFQNLKDKVLRKKKPIIVPVDPVIPIEPELVVKPKRKYSPRKPKLIEVIEPEENDSILSEEVVDLMKKSGRKVVDTNLTVDLADHIAKSLPQGKKSLNANQRRIMSHQEILEWEKQNTDE